MKNKLHTLAMISTGVISVALLLSGCSFNPSAKQQSTAKYNYHNTRDWHSGMPKIFKTSDPAHSLWLSNYYTKDGKNIIESAKLNQLSGFNPVALIYNNHHQFEVTGGITNPEQNSTPYYKKVGNHKYLAISGNDFIRQDFGRFIHPTKYNPINYVYIKVHRHHAQIWSLGRKGLKGHRAYMGDFHKTHYNYQELIKKNKKHQAPMNNQLD